MLVGWLYEFGKDKILRLCIEGIESEFYLEQAHIAIGNIHISLEKTIKQIECMGVYWSSMRKEIHTYVQRCFCSKEKDQMLSVNSCTFKYCRRLLFNKCDSQDYCKSLNLVTNTF